MKTWMTALLLLCFLSPFYSAAQSPVDQHGMLSVNGNKILDKSNNPVSLVGMSLFWSNTNWGGEEFYTEEVVDWLIEDWNITVIRAAMGVDENGGYLSDESNKDRVKKIVDKAIQEGIYVIIDWHSHHAHDYEQEAIDFFGEMAEAYGDYPNVIYEIYNEPMQISWANTIKPYAESVISAIRAIDPDNLIIVGNSTWSQDVDIVSQNPIEDQINIAYTLHFYAATHGQNLRDKAKVALDNGIALFVTEWGTVSANGDGAIDEAETSAWMDFLCEHAIGHCNWALNDKPEGASVLKEGASPLGGWSINDLTTSGILVKDIIKDWCLSVDSKQVYTQKKVKIYPNPSENTIQVNLGYYNLYKELSLRNAEGIDLRSLDVNFDQKEIEIDLSDLKPGIYFLYLKSQDNLLVKKIIKL